MSAQTVRQPVDLDPPAPARLLLDLAIDLALALPSILGVSIAWDFASGGDVTTGVPLGIASIIIGPQVHTPGSVGGSRMALPAIIVGALAVLSAAFFATVGSPDSKAQAPAATTINLKELEKGSTFIHLRNTKLRNQRSLALGDLLAFANPIADVSGKVVGKLHVSCVGTVGNRDFRKAVLTCTGVMRLSDGSLMMQANSSPGSATTTGAVVGGTGAYAGARGVFVSTHSSSGANDTITLAG